MNRYKPYSDVLVLDELIYILRKKYGIPFNISIDFIESSVLPYITPLQLGEEEYLNAIKILKNYNKV